MPPSRQRQARIGLLVVPTIATHSATAAERTKATQFKTESGGRAIGGQPPDGGGKSAGDPRE